MERASESRKTASEKSEDFQFLLDYLNHTCSDPEAEIKSREWVSTMIGMPTDSSYEEIKRKLEKTVRSNVAASKFGI
jgi:hypothetical protein